MEIYVIAIAAVILLIAVAILFARRPRAGYDTQELAQLRAEKEALAIELARAQQQAEGLVAEKDGVTDLFREEQQRLRDGLQETRGEVKEADKSLESARAYYQSQQERLDEQKAEIATIKKQFNTEFQVIANRILEEKTQKFTETNSKSLDQILGPLKDKIKTFE